MSARQLHGVDQRLIPGGIGPGVHGLNHGGVSADGLVGQLQRQKLGPTLIGHTHIDDRSPKVCGLSVGPDKIVLSQVPQVLRKHALTHFLQHGVDYAKPAPSEET